MQSADVSAQTLQRLQALAAARGQCLQTWLDQLVRLEEGRSCAERRLAGGASADPLVEVVDEYLARLCASERERHRVSAALWAAATDGELCRVGPLGRDGVTLDISPEPHYVRISGGGGRFAISDAAVRRVADRLSQARWRPTLAA
jgi:hypothetical protein